MKGKSIFKKTSFWILVALIIVFGGFAIWKTASPQQGASIFSLPNTGIIARACNPANPFTHSSGSSPWIQVVSPNGGEIYQPGQTIVVKWNSCNVTTPNVEIGLADTTTNQFAMLAGSVPNNGSATVTLPAAGSLLSGQPLQLGTYYKVEIDGGTHPIISGSSANLFTIEFPIAASLSGQSAVGLAQTANQTHENGQFTLTFTVTALNSTMYIPAGVRNTQPAADGYVHYDLTNGYNSVGASALSAILTSPVVLSGDVTGTAYIVPAGTSRAFTLSVGLNNNSGVTGTGTGQYILHLTGINYSSASNLNPSFDYTFGLNTIETNPPLFLQ